MATTCQLQLFSKVVDVQSSGKLEPAIQNVFQHTLRELWFTLCTFMLEH